MVFFSHFVLSHYPVIRPVDLTYEEYSLNNPFKNLHIIQSILKLSFDYPLIVQKCAVQTSGKQLTYMKLPVSCLVKVLYQTVMRGLKLFHDNPTEIN